MIFGQHLHGRQGSPFGQGRQGPVVVIIVVPAFLVNRQIAGKFHDLAPSLEQGLTGGDFGSGLADASRCHLAGQRTAVDQFVELLLVRLQLAQLGGIMKMGAGRADGLMGLLGIFHLSLVEPGLVGQVFRAETLADEGPGGVQRLP